MWSRKVVEFQLAHIRNRYGQSVREGRRSISSSFASSFSSSAEEGQTTTTLPKEADIVIIGGGVIGCSLAYHLSKHYPGEGSGIVLLEAQKLTAGTTWHAAGLIGQLRGTETETRLSSYGSKLYRQLEDETGYATGFKACGSLTLARNADRLRALQLASIRAKAFGIEAHIISPAEAKRLWSPMQVDDLEAALWLPGDGTADPSSVAQSLAKGAKLAGVRIFEDQRVVAIPVEDGAVTGVQVRSDSIAPDSPPHFIKSRIVVNCAGQWARKVGKLCGVNVPLHSAEHFYIVTKQVEGVTSSMPLMRDPDGYTYFREWSGGLLAGGFEPQGKPCFTKEVPDRFAFQLFDEDWDHFQVLMDEILHRVPVIGKTQIRSMVNGPESFTVDNQYILGEAPELKRFYVAAGFNSSGIAGAAGAGLALSHWIAKGQPASDLWTVDIRRFGAFQNNPTFLRERVGEALGVHYQIGWPRREMQAARNLRRSALYSKLRDNGGVFGSKFGWERPNFYAPSVREADEVRTKHSPFGSPWWRSWVTAEHLAARHSVALFDQSSFSKLLVQGRDALALLDRLCANNINVPVGTVVYTGMLNERGGYESDVTVTRVADDSFMVVTSTGQATRDAHCINKHIDKDQFVVCTDVTSMYSVLGVMGPQSRALLQSVSSIPFDNDSFPFGTSQMVDLGLATVRASRITYVGELGWELYIPTEMAAYVYELLKEQGAKANVPIADAGYYAIDSLRVEKGYRAWGVELTPDYTPLEAGLAFAVAWDKPAHFIGKEALLRQKAQGVDGLNRRLLSFVVDDDEDHSSYWLLGAEGIYCNGQQLGYTTSSQHGHFLGKGVALGYVARPAPSLRLDADFIKNSTWELDVGNRKIRVKASLAAPLDPKAQRVKGIYP